MPLMKPEFIGKHALKLAMLGVGAFLLLHSSVDAKEVMRGSDRVDILVEKRGEPVNHQQLASETIQNDRPMQIALVENLCPLIPEQNLEPYITAETSGFVVSICGSGGTPTNYVAKAKNGKGTINVLLQSYDSKAKRYVAVNGAVRYTLTRNKLTAIQGRKTLVNQKVTRWD